MSNQDAFFYRSKAWIPNISYLYCDHNGWILEDQTKPQGTIIDNLTDDEAMKSVREYRNQLLSSCDWTQLPDVELTDAQVLLWKNYRKALRDFPSQINVKDWTGPDWPTPPE